MIKVVLFDLDDTLISEDEYIRSGYQHIAEVLKKRYQIQSENVAEELYKLYEESAKNVFNRFLDMSGICYGMDDMRYLVNEYRSHMPKISYYNDVVDTVQELKENAIRLGIISDGYLLTQKKKAEAVQLQNFFEKIIFTDELGREYWKPNPKAFEIMKDYFDVDYCEMAYVGDNPQKDFYIKKTYPIKTIRIKRYKSVYCDTEYFNNVREDTSIVTLKDIINVV